MQDYESMAQRHNDILLDKYLSKTSMEPFRPCDYCGKNIFDYDHYFNVGGDIVCERCCSMESTDKLEVIEWR